MQPFEKMDKEHQDILHSMDKTMVARILKNLRYKKGKLVCKHDKHQICTQCLKEIYDDAARTWNPDVAERLKQALKTGEYI